MRGENLDKSNILIDFKVLKKKVNEIVNYLDHTDINTLPEFENVSPSSEIISKFLYEKIKLEIPNVSKVSVFETPTSCASYFEQ